MSQALIRRAFEAALDTWATANSVTVAWENIEFAQPEGAYVRAYLLPAATTSADYGRVNRREVGIFQVTIVMPTGTGPGAAETLIASLSTAFPPATALTVSTFKVWITEPLSTGPAIQELDRYTIPCSLPYAADHY